MTLPDLRTIAENAKKDAYSIDRIQWHKGVETQRHYFPEMLTPLYHCASYRTVLDEDDRRLYNQLYSQYISEQFIFLEDRFLCRVVDGLLPWASQVSWDLKRCLEIFLEEEVKHTEMFRRLNRLCNPEVYGDKDFRFLQLRPIENKLMEAMSKYPKVLNFWIWVALLFEEKTIDCFSHYRMQQRDPQALKIDPLHYQVHQFHMLDEARHVQLDEHLLRYIFNKANPIVRQVNIALLKKTMSNYTNPKRANILIVEDLCKIQVRLRSQVERLSNEVRAQNGKAGYQIAQYSRKNFPKTFSYFDADPDVRSAMSQVILTYQPQEEGLSA
ncbi:MAG: hypothetical protein RI932_778 [Pseudomonadota bacterium]|jgi:hypothetical protein